MSVTECVGGPRVMQLCSIAALQPTSQKCQMVNNISVTTSGLLTGSRNDYKCMAVTWMLSAQPGQHIELVVRDYTSSEAVTSSSDDDEAAETGDEDDDDGEDDDDDRKSR